MRQVITHIPIRKDAPITPDQVSLNKCYGVTIPNSKGFISRRDYDQGPFIVKSLQSVTNGNYHFWSDEFSLSGLIQRLLDNRPNCKVDVYEFDTARELFEWLAKE